jgi:hypothetical protein
MAAAIFFKTAAAADRARSDALPDCDASLIAMHT